MSTDLPYDEVKPDKIKFIFIALCVVALIGFFLPAVKASLSIFDETFTSGFCLTTVIHKSDGMLDRFGLEDSEISEIADEINLIDILEDAVRAIIFSSASYFAVLLLILIVLALTLSGKFILVRFVMIVASLILFIIAGSVILTVPEIAMDILDSSIEEYPDFLSFDSDISEVISLKLGIGYWITIISIIAMLVIETKVRYKDFFPAKKDPE